MPILAFSPTVGENAKIGIIGQGSCVHLVQMYVIIFWEVATAPGLVSTSIFIAIV